MRLSESSLSESSQDSDGSELNQDSDKSEFFQPVSAAPLPAAAQSQSVQSQCLDPGSALLEPLPYLQLPNFINVACNPLPL